MVEVVWRKIYNQYCSGAAGRLHNSFYGAVWNLLHRYGGRLNFKCLYSSHQKGYMGRFTGHKSLKTTPDALVYSRLIVLWGAHFSESIFGTNTMWYMTQAKEAGARIVYIGPYMNDTCATLADQWIPIYPGTDTTMMLAMVYVMLEENLLDKGFINTFIHGFYSAAEGGDKDVPAGKSLKDYILGTSAYPAKHFGDVAKTPEWAEAITGVKASTIAELAREYADTMKPAFTMASLGMVRQAEGEQNAFMLDALVAITGNWGVLGSGYGLRSKGIKLGGYRHVPNPVKKKIRAMAWSDAAANPGNSEWGDGEVNALEHGIKFMFNLAGNILNQHMDCNKTKVLLKDKSKIEFIVVMDNFMTPTARYADIILPGTMNWEQNDLFSKWAIGNSVIYANKAVEPPGETKTIYEFLTLLSYKLGLDKPPDRAKAINNSMTLSTSQPGFFQPRGAVKTVYDYLKLLAFRLGLMGGFTEGKTEDDWLRKMWKATGEPISYEELKKRGVYTFNLGRPPLVQGKDIRDNGAIDAKHRFATASGKLEVYSQAMVEEYENRGTGYINDDGTGDPIVYPIPMYFPSWEGRDDPLTAQYPLQGVTSRSRSRANSTHNNNPYLRELYGFDSDGNSAHDADTYGVNPAGRFGGNGLEQVWINASDARSRGISHRDKVKVYNGRGAVYASAHVTHRVMPGVIILHQGSWYETDTDGVDAGGCANTLTNERPSRIAHGSCQMTLLAEVVKV
ncbi:MAG: molybdopterin-dependent oxidoreductase [Candidatus Mariimomonas ferrooxydans]